MSNLTAALMCVASSLRSLVFETHGVLVISQWAAALARLETVCFIGGEVQLKQVGWAPRHAALWHAALRHAALRHAMIRCAALCLGSWCDSPCPGLGLEACCCLPRRGF